MVNGQFKGKGLVHIQCEGGLGTTCKGKRLYRIESKMSVFREVGAAVLEGDDSNLTGRIPGWSPGATQYLGRAHRGLVRAGVIGKRLGWAPGDTQ